MEGLSELEEFAHPEGLLWELNMANRRNYRRHRGIADSVQESPVELETSKPLSLEELAAMADAAADPTPGSRSEKVERAKRLIADPEYPNTKVLNSIAELLADHLSPPAPH